MNAQLVTINVIPPDPLAKTQLGHISACADKVIKVLVTYASTSMNVQTRNSITVNSDVKIPMDPILVYAMMDSNRETIAGNVLVSKMCELR